MTDERYPPGVDYEAPYQPSQYDLVQLRVFLEQNPDIENHGQAYGRHTELMGSASVTESAAAARDYRNMAARAWTATGVLRYFEDNGVSVEDGLASLDDKG